MSKPHKKKVLVIFGTRPEAVKMAPVVHALKADASHFEITVCVTAQHRQMLDQILTLFGITPDIDLDLMTHDQTLSELTAKAMRSVTGVLEKLRPDWVLVQGDTTTAMIAALAAFYQKIPVGHIEAGLRTHDPYQPFPEEINRQLIGVLGALHFAPTEKARQALLKEGTADGKVFCTGNTVVDALRWVVKKVEDESGTSKDTGGPRIILVTAHRRENFDKPLENICKALVQIADTHPDVRIIYPVHLNPNVSGPVARLLSNHARIALMPPVGYRELVELLHASHIVITDSGGIQEEAPALGKPVLVVREKTERPEGVAAGVSKLVGTDTERIVREAGILLTDEAAYARMSKAVSPYGDGQASSRIVDILRHA